MTDVEICNLALSWLAAPQIAALADPDKRAVLCNTNFTACLNAVLAAREWTFAVEWRSISAAAQAPINPAYGQRFAITADVLRVLGCDDGSGDGRLQWEREGSYILANLSQVTPTPLLVRALVVVSPAALSYGAAQAVAARLAAVIAIALTENRSLQADMWKLYEALVGEAATLDGMQGRSVVVRADTLKRKRRGGSAEDGV